MRIALLVNRDIASNYAVNLLLPALREQLVAIFLSPKVGGPPRPPSLLDSLGFVEQDLWNQVVFPGLAGTDPAGRYLGFGEFERHLGIPERTLDSLRRPENLDALHGAEADLFISIRFGHVLRDDAIAIPPLGVLNLHSGLLPAYRGVLPTLRALAHGDSEIGCTLHRVDSPGIDVGPIVAQARCPFDRASSLLAHVLSLYPLGAPLIADAVACLARGENLATTLQPAEGGYFTFPTHDETVAFCAQGWRLFDRRDLLDLLIRYRPS